MMLRNAAFALLLLPALAAAAPEPPALEGSVAALRLEARGGRTELTVEVAGADVRWTDFALSGPARVVVDIADARLDLPARRFDGLDRGGVRGVRTSQHDETTVRVVLDLDRETGYRVERVPAGLRISLESGVTAFQPWSSGSGAPAQSASASRPAATPRAQQTSQARRITVSFENTEMRDVALRTLLRPTGWRPRSWRGASSGWTASRPWPRGPPPSPW
jgi:hypothetical protein